MNKYALLSLGAVALASPAFAAQTIPVPDVAPAAAGYQVVINIPQQRLFLFKDGSLKKVYPVGVGKAMSQTNIGEHKIGAKAFNPTWHIPLSIQKERGDGVKSVPPGPKNPLGPVFVRLGNPKLGLGIHGTSNPASVPGVVSHGCVRMKSPDALQFAKTVSTGSPADVIYQMAALNEDGAGNLWLAAFRDPYNKKNLDTAALRKSIAAWSKAKDKTVSAKQIDAVLKSRTGALHCISCGGTKSKISGELKSLAWTSGSGSLSKAKAAAKAATPADDQILPEGSEIEIDADTDAGIRTLIPATALSPKNRAASQPEAPASDAAQGEDNLF